MLQFNVKRDCFGIIFTPYTRLYICTLSTYYIKVRVSGESILAEVLFSAEFRFVAQFSAGVALDFATVVA